MRHRGAESEFTLDTVRSVISCSKARVSSACFWLCSAIFSLNFLGLEPPVPGELDMVRAATFHNFGYFSGREGSFKNKKINNKAYFVGVYSVDCLWEAMGVWESTAHIANGAKFLHSQLTTVREPG